MNAMQNFNLKFNKNGLISAMLVSCVLYLPVSEARMYKWVDEDGNTNYTQSPPPGGVDGETIKPPPKIDDDNAIAEVERQTKDADKLRENRKEKEKIDALQKENNEVKKENCRRSKQKLNNYSRPRGLIQQEDGSRVRIDEEARQAGLVEAQKKIEEYCQ